MPTPTRQYSDRRERQDAHWFTVLHIAQSSGGGVARVVADLAARQQARGDRVVVACLPDTRLSTAAAQGGAEVRVWNARRSPGPALVKEAAELHRLVERVRPDVVHLHSSKAGLAGRLALRGALPTVFQPHAWSFEAVTGPMAVATVRWERAGARWAHRLVCVSEGERGQGEAAGVHAAYTIVRNGVDIGHFDSATAPSRETVRARLGIPASTPLVVCVARLCRQKGQDVLLAAWPRVVDRVPGARLVLVGDGSDRAALAARAPSAVSFAGDVADPRDWYIAADLVTLSSRWEAGMALAPLEAMACSRPVVVTDVPGAREFLPPRQATDCLVPRDDPAALGGKLTHLLADRASGRALGKQAHDYTRRHHSVDQVVERMYAVYGEAVRAWADGVRPEGQ
ncbi:glycosyltransferase [Streptomyces sp. NPDC007984]|uniref:glycosyltransferase family 4 protein n=1 Tax=Streptomyces sp. NPDC007984 TaxID=3364801 RepID=UPI0036E72F14